MEDLRCRLDDEIHLLMPRGDVCWTLEQYINFVLWLDGSFFTVGEAEFAGGTTQFKVFFVATVSAHAQSLFRHPAPS